MDINEFKKDYNFLVKSSKRYISILENFNGKYQDIIIRDIHETLCDDEDFMKSVSETKIIFNKIIDEIK